MQMDHFKIINPRQIQADPSGIYSQPETIKTNINAHFFLNTYVNHVIIIEYSQKENKETLETDNT